MPETEVDLRRWRILLLSHDVFTTPQAGPVVDWAARHDAGLYQLPLPAHALRPRTPAGRSIPPRVAELREEEAQLGAVFADIASYLSAGYHLLGLAITATTTRTAAGRAWLQRVRRLAAETTGQELTTWVLPALPETLQP